jgi:hypothetical protein
MGNNKKIESLFNSFVVNGELESCEPFGNGHINDTFLITTKGENAPNYILQRKNHLVFTDVPGMMNNIVRVTDHIRIKLMEQGETGIERKVMTYYPAPDRKFYVNDEEGNFWVLFLYIKNSHGIEQVTEATQAYSAGTAFGHFQSQLSDLIGANLIEPIPNYHNGEFRLKQLNDAIKNNAAGRLESVKDVADKLLARADEMVKLQQWVNTGKLPLRITHNDTKINNVLFDKENNILCVIDLDTVSPATILFDFGDAIRCLGNKAPEDEPDLNKIAFNKDYFKAYAEGYLKEANEFLTSFEKSNLAFGCLYMTWEQSVRFFTDYLNGDTYYKIQYPEHNIVRARAQLKYLEVLEEERDYMEGVIA